MEGVEAALHEQRGKQSKAFRRRTTAGRSLMFPHLATNQAGLWPTQGEETMPALDPVVLNPLIALIAGILILIMPRLLNYVVAIYLIAIGIIGLSHHFQ
jgi:hypothetical protein